MNNKANTLRLCDSSMYVSHMDSSQAHQSVSSESPRLQLAFERRVFSIGKDTFALNFKTLIVYDIFRGKQSHCLVSLLRALDGHHSLDGTVPAAALLALTSASLLACRSHRTRSSTCEQQVPYAAQPWAG